jgi:hypothetical protein
VTTPGFLGQDSVPGTPPGTGGPLGRMLAAALAHRRGPTRDTRRLATMDADDLLVPAVVQQVERTAHAIALWVPGVTESWTSREGRPADHDASVGLGSVTLEEHVGVRVVGDAELRRVDPSDLVPGALGGQDDGTSVVLLAGDLSQRAVADRVAEISGAFAGVPGVLLLDPRAAAAFLALTPPRLAALAAAVAEAQVWHG